jgi:hypothetical protein
LSQAFNYLGIEFFAPVVKGAAVNRPVVHELISELPAFQGTLALTHSSSPGAFYFLPQGT